MVSCLITEEVLQETISKLYNAFVDCPTADGKPYDDLESAMKSLEDFIAVTQKMAQAVGSVDESFLENIDLLVSAYHEFWRRPFPVGFESGQKVSSAIMERALRNMLKTFEGLTQDNCNANNPIEIDLIPIAEAERFNDWAEGLPAVSDMDSNGNTPIRVMHQPPPPSSYGMGSLIASFLLGWWIGSD